MIELKEVTKEYSKGIAALNGINLRIEQGEFVFVVGDSGSGKSTLIPLSAAIPFEYSLVTDVYKRQPFIPWSSRLPSALLNWS